jgi:hypothetical protein
MIKVEFDISVDKEIAQDSPLFDESETAMMLRHTQAQIEKHVQQSLGELRCEEHGEQAKVLISGGYSLETEQLDVSYHVDTCCKAFLLKAVAALNLHR